MNFWIIDPPGRSAFVPNNVLNLLLFFSFEVVTYGLVVKNPGSHPFGPVSTPAMEISDPFSHQVT